MDRGGETFVGLSAFRLEALGRERDAQSGEVGRTECAFIFRGFRRHQAERSLFVNVGAAPPAGERRQVMGRGAGHGFLRIGAGRRKSCA